MACLKGNVAGPQVSDGGKPRPLSDAGGSSDGLVLSSPSGSRTNAHRGSQILLFKPQNPDVRNNTAGVFDDVATHKDFGKRVINMNVLPSSGTSSNSSPAEILTVLV